MMAAGCVHRVLGGEDGLVGFGTAFPVGCRDDVTCSQTRYYAPHALGLVKELIYTTTSAATWPAALLFTYNLILILILGARFTGPDLDED